VHRKLIADPRSLRPNGTGFQQEEFKAVQRKTAIMMGKVTSELERYTFELSRLNSLLARVPLRTRPGSEHSVHTLTVEVLCDQLSKTLLFILALNYNALPLHGCAGRERQSVIHCHSQVHHTLSCSQQPCSVDRLHTSTRRDDLARPSTHA
jgi:hypothetical protein